MKIACPCCGGGLAGKEVLRTLLVTRGLGIKEDILDFLMTKPKGATVEEIADYVWRRTPTPLTYQVMIRQYIHRLRPYMHELGYTIGVDRNGPNSRYLIKKVGK